MPPVRIGIVYYSVYGHVRALAEQVLEGINSVEGCEGLMHQVAETLPSEILEHIKAPPKTNDPVIKAEQLPDFDGLIFGFPTRHDFRAAWLLPGRDMFALDEVKGGSPWGSVPCWRGQIARVSEKERKYALHQGRYFAGVVKRLAATK